MTRFTATPRVINPQLPARIRLRLHAERVIDGIAGWISERGPRGARVAELLWRACRMW